VLAEKIALIVPIAHDLARGGYDEVIIGPGSANACAQAVDIAREYQCPHVLLTASEAGRQWEHRNLGQIMAGYVGRLNPTLPARYHQARWFKTYGEIIAVAEYVKMFGARSAEATFECVVFAVKDWHADRVQALAEKVFLLEGVAVPIVIRPHYSYGSRLDRASELIKKPLHLFRVGQIYRKKRREERRTARNKTH
jgi:hypothetical protein